MKPSAMLLRGALFAAAIGCARERVEQAPALPVEEDARVLAPPEDVVVDSSYFGEPQRVVERAFHRDDTVTRSEIRVRRIIYQVTPIISWALGPGRTDLLPPTGELLLDVAGSRLRARFVGNGFACDENSQVRMRADEHGTYVFDGKGGRPVGTGQLAAWYQSGPGARGVELKLRQGVPDDPHTIELVCRFFGEWAGASIAAVRRSCAAMGLPTKFRFGPYRIERTAESVVYLSESALRSDELEPPRALVHDPSPIFFEPIALSRIAPSIEDVPERRIRPGEVIPQVDEGVVIENRTGARVLVTVDGVALGWLDPSTTEHFRGIPAGGHWVGAMFPLGGLAARRSAYTFPAYVVLGR